MDKITIRMERNGSNFLLAKNDEFLMTDTENVVRRGNALFFIINGYIEIYETEVAAEMEFEALCNVGKNHV
jgi:hypothetical protein